MDTHGDPHLELEVQYAADDDPTLVDGLVVVSLMCAVSPVYWNGTLKYASRSLLILSALGIHPWNSVDMIMADDIENHYNCEDVTWKNASTGIG